MRQSESNDEGRIVLQQTVLKKRAVSQGVIPWSNLFKRQAGVLGIGGQVAISIPTW